MGHYTKLEEAKAENQKHTFVPDIDLVSPEGKQKYQEELAQKIQKEYVESLAIPDFCQDEYSTEWENWTDGIFEKQQRAVFNAKANCTENTCIDCAIAKEQIPMPQEKGTRYCFLDLIPLVTDFQDTLIHDFCVRFTRLVYEGNPNQEVQVYEELMLYITNHFVNDPWRLWKNVLKVRTFDLENNRYSLQSYQNQVSINDLHDNIAEHLIKYMTCNLRDEESGVNHLAHIVCELLVCAGQLWNAHE